MEQDWKKYGILMRKPKIIHTKTEKQNEAKHLKRKKQNKIK